MPKCKINPIENVIAQFVKLKIEHPNKTIKWSHKGIEALETDAPPELIIEGKINGRNQQY